MSHLVSLTDRRRLLDIARGLLGTQADAEDAVHDAYLRLLTSAPAGLETPVAWLTTVVKHLAIDGLRRRQVERRELGATVQAATAPPAQDQAEASQRLAQALRLLADSLQPVEAALVLLHEVFEFSHAAIAERCGRSEAGCRQTVHRALMRLRAAASEEIEPEDRATADALFVLCQRALQTRSPAPLHAILGVPGTRACASARPAESANASIPRSGIVQVEGGYALVWMSEGKPVCCLALGPATASAECV